MCGRFTLSAPAELVAELFELAEKPALIPRYNIAPTQPAPVVLWDRERSQRRFELLRWGLIPSWADDPSIGNRMINARAETAATKPAFRAAFRLRRCLILADGFYEWKASSVPPRGGGREGGKQPFYVRMQDGGPFAFAGLWDHWEGPGMPLVAGPPVQRIDSCTILTTGPNDVIRPVHNRMPVILPPQEYGRWLDPEVQRVDLLLPLLRPYPPDRMTAYPISTRVNNPANDSPACISPLRRS